MGSSEKCGLTVNDWQATVAVSSKCASDDSYLQASNDLIMVMVIFLQEMWIGVFHHVCGEQEWENGVSAPMDS